MVWLRAAPGTERYRLHRRFNWDMNSASVSLFSTTDKREEEGEKEREKTNKRRCSLLLLSSQLLMYSLLSRGEEHSSRAHFSLKLLVYGGQTAPCEVTGQMLWSWDEMHGLRKSMSAGLFSPSLSKHTAVEFNSRTTLHPGMTTANKPFNATFHESCTVTLLYISFHFLRELQSFQDYYDG